MITFRFALIVFAVLAAALMLSCKHRQREVSSSDGADLDPCSTSNDYFPPPAANWPGGKLHFGADQGAWEANFLRHMHEPSLYACIPATAEPVYRFLWDRSLSEPVAARLVVHNDGSGILFVKMLAHGTMLPPPETGVKPVSQDEWYRMKLEHEIALTPEQVRRALNLVNQIEFVTESNSHETTDGSDWIFESKVKGKYKLVDFRNIPTVPARELGLYLVLDLAKLPIPTDAIY